MIKRVGAALIAAMLLAPVSYADTSPDQLMTKYGAEVKKKNKSFKAFSADAGKTFFNKVNVTKKKEKMSCATCHTKDPTKIGKTRAGKDIDPIAHTANAERFTDSKKVEKWFKRNCQDVYDRECTAQEKGDFVAYMKSPK